MLETAEGAFFGGQTMARIHTIGLDIGKEVFQVHGIDAAGKVLVRKQLLRAEVLDYFKSLSPCLVGIEVTGSCHQWARSFLKMGHSVRLMPAQYVKAYVKRNKNDANDAEAICEAVTRPNMRFVPVKSLEQQSDLTLHRVRQGFVEERTATLNRLRGLLAEFGHVLPLRAVEVRRQVPQLLGTLPSRVAACARDLLQHAAQLEVKALEYEHEIRTHVRSNALARRAQTRMGIGPITASALVATVGNGRDFKNGRQFAAWLGLVPSQYSTGGKTRLGHITRRGDPYLRTLLVMGARAVLQRAVSLTDPFSRWALAV